MAKTKVPAKPKTKEVPVVEVSGEKLKRVSDIRTYKKDVLSFKSRIKVIQADMAEIVDNTDEGTEVLKLEQQLETARANLRRRLEGNSEWAKLTEDLADERLSLRDAERILSDYLLAYFADTKEKQVELGPHEAHEVILNGKLGKEKDFQTNLFSASAQEANNE